jgi:hypothetical protein
MLARDLQSAKAFLLSGVALVSPVFVSTPHSELYWVL